MIGAKYKPYPKYKKSGVEWIGEVIHVITVYRPDVREWDETFTQRR